MTGLDHLDYQDVEFLAEVHRTVRKAAELAGGSVPAAGSPEWWSAPPAARLAGVLVLAQRYLLEEPHQLAAELLKGMSVDISAGMDWSAFAERHVSHHAELERIRAELGPLWQPYAGGPVAWEATTREAAA